MKAVCLSVCLCVCLSVPRPLLHWFHIMLHYDERQTCVIARAIHVLLFSNSLHAVVTRCSRSLP